MTSWLVEHLGAALEALGVLLITGGLLFGFARALQRGADRYARLRHDLGRSILLGLEVLVAADIVRSVALAPSMNALAVLAAIVVIRTFLSWSLALELDGRWPWQPQAATGNAQPQAATGNAQPQAATGNAQPQAATGNALPQAAPGHPQRPPSPHP